MGAAVVLVALGFNLRQIQLPQALFSSHPAFAGLDTFDASASVAHVAEQVLPSVVNISSTRKVQTANSPFFDDIAGKHIAAAASGLPAGVVAAAKARGRKLEPRKAVEGLLEELRELGWGA